MPRRPKPPGLVWLKKQLAAQITDALGGSHSQYVTAPSFGIPQPRMSELARGNVDRCTLDWLIRAIYRLDGSVTISADVPRLKLSWSRSATSAPE